MEFGRDGNTGGGSYYRGPGNRAYASNRGRTAEFDGTVVFEANDILIPEDPQPLAIPKVLLSTFEVVLLL